LRRVSDFARERGAVLARAAPETQVDGGAPGGRVEILLVCTSGGHLLELFALRAAWRGLESVWVTMEGPEARWLLRDERVVLAHAQEARSAKNIGRNLVLAWRLMSRRRPRVIVTTGAALAVPFVWVGRVRGARIVYVESATRVTGRSLTCRLVAPVADRIYVQWPDLVPVVRGARYAGSVLGLPEP
jgi:beta-1,4-N-acetylglucosaminyltransferase